MELGGPWSARGRAALARLAALVSLVAVTGCSGDEPVDAPRPPRPQLSVSVSQPRPDEGTDLLRAAVVNEGPDSLTVRRATLDWPGFTRREARVGERIGPGEVAGFALRHGRPRCGGSHGSRPAVRVLLGDAGSVVAHSVRLADDDADTVLRLHERACLGEELRATARVDLVLATSTPPSPATTDGLPGTVVVTRRAGSTDPVELVDLAGSVLLRLVADRPLPAVLGPRARVLRVPVHVAPTQRCDAHALTNSSQTFLLALYVQVAGREPQRVIRFPSAPARRELTRLLDRACHAR